MELNDFRVGQGFDVHAFAKDRQLILCGEHIDYEMGLLGHSDADVAIHALIDALLGAASKRDIGYYFPDNSSDFKDIDSTILLKRVVEILENDKWKISNIDLTIIAQKPKISPYIENMKNRIANLLKIDLNRVSIKATTTEKLGFTGRKEGIASICSVLIYK